MEFKAASGEESAEHFAGRLSDDRRIGPRVQLPRPITLRHDGADLPATVVDCSPAGIGIVADFSLAEGAAFVIRSGGAVSLLAYHVAHCRALPGGQFRIGARLAACNISDPTVEEIVAALSAV